jgi:hypothetical protein
MVNQPGGGAAAVNCHIQRVGHELGFHVLGHRLTGYL